MRPGGFETLKAKAPVPSPWVRTVLLAITVFLKIESAACATSGTVTAWGSNENGQTTIPTNLTDVIAVAAAPGYNLALKSDGTVVAWGSTTAVPTNLSGVIAIAAGVGHSLALTRDGRVTAWGDNNYGQSTVPTDLQRVIAVAAGADHSVALKADGTVVTWGGNQYGERNTPPNLGQVTAIATCYRNNVALKADGSVASWGELSNIPRITGRVVAIAAGVAHQLALREDGTVVGWGENTWGQANAPFGLNSVVAIAAGFYHSIAIKRDGTVVLWGRNDGGQSTVPSTVGQVSASAGGYFHTVAIVGIPHALGTPSLFIDGMIAADQPIFARGPATVSLRTVFPAGTLLFTLDGSSPDVTAHFYGGPFVVKKSAQLRTIAYNVDFTQSAESDPLDLTILPTLDASTEGGGTISITPPSGQYFSNGTARLAALPLPGWTFAQWLGDLTGTNRITDIRMSRDRHVQAVFTTSLSNTVVGNGNIHVGPASDRYPYGASVNVTAEPQPGSYFALWANAASTTNNPLLFTINRARPTITAVFAALPANQFALAVIPEGAGTITHQPQLNRFPSGSAVTIRALPEPGQQFLGWSGDAIGTNNPLIVTMTSNKIITAAFTRRPMFVRKFPEDIGNGEDFQLLLVGEYPGRYLIETTDSLSADAVAWRPLVIVTNVFGKVQFNDPFDISRPQRFYRTSIP